ncbi:response regulator [bacterium]|nr:response regulator [bacterium]
MNTIKPKKILLADDEPDFVSLLSQALVSVGFEVITASEGLRAIQMAHQQKPDLMLLDVNMPGGTGDVVLKALRGKEDTKNLPVIIVTAATEESLAKRLVANGANAIVIKPFEMPDLLTTIQNLLDQEAIHII